MRIERITLLVLTLAIGSGPAPAAISTVDQQVIEQSVVSSPEFHDYFGTALVAGDFNGDGVPDLAVGAHGEDFGGVSSSGVVSIYYGGPSGLGEIQSVVPGAGTVPGELEEFAFFGRRLATGDFDEDGLDDLAIGAWADAGGQSQAGTVTVLYGAPGGLGDLGGGQLWSQASAGVPGAPGVQEFFGAELATGDFDGDGSSDLAIGTPRDDGLADNNGVVTILYGGGAGLSTAGIDAFTGNNLGCASASEADELGDAVAAGDFDGDGYADLAIGVPGEDDVPGGPTVSGSGLVVVVPGSSTGLLAGDALCLYPGAAIAGGSVPGTRAPGGRFGSALAAGNFNRFLFTQYDDLAIGNPGVNTGAPASGEVVVLPGSGDGVAAGSGYRFDSGDIAGTPATENSQQFGATLAAMKAHGNASSDLLIHWHPGGADAVSGYGLIVVPGSWSGLDLARALPLTASRPGILVGPGEDDDQFGIATASGDFDDDGHRDLAIGMPGKNVGSGASNAGAVLVLGGSLFSDDFETGDARFWVLAAP